MSITRLKNCKIIDPAHKKEGVLEDIYIRDGKIIAKPSADEKITQVYDLKQKTVMAGAIDMHSHIGGGKVNIARMLLPEFRNYTEPEAHICTPNCSHHATPTTTEIGFKYIEMGYTAAFEPAMMPINARQAHLEMADTPMIDKGGYVMLGNDDYFLRLLSQKADQKIINNYVAWTLHATQAIGIKVVNPGGISAFNCTSHYNFPR